MINWVTLIRQSNQALHHHHPQQLPRRTLLMNPNPILEITTPTPTTTTTTAAAIAPLTTNHNSNNNSNSNNSNNSFHNHPILTSIKTSPIHSALFIIKTSIVFINILVPLLQVISSMRATTATATATAIATTRTPNYFEALITTPPNSTYHSITFHPLPSTTPPTQQTMYKK